MSIDLMYSLYDRLLFKIQQEYWPALKSFLIFLNTITEDELDHIKRDDEVLKLLREL